MDFDFNQSSSTADPSTPRPYYHSAPTSPSRFSDFLTLKTTLTPKSPKHEFAFDLSQEMDTTSLSADQLFDGGIIRPLNPPPVSTRGRERERVSNSSTRSLSPFRVSEYPWEEEEEEDLNTKESTTPMPSTTSSSKGHRKWRLMDFFLFRSASEGRATGKDPYASLFKSSRKVDSQGSGSRSSRKGPVSAHELHYTTNRAVSEDLKKKTFLPYKQGILGRLAFNPAF